jgi:hypothetical protein
VQSVQGARRKLRGAAGARSADAVLDEAGEHPAGGRTVSFFMESHDRGGDAAAPGDWPVYGESAVELHDVLVGDAGGLEAFTAFHQVADVRLGLTENEGDLVGPQRGVADGDMAVADEHPPTLRLTSATQRVFRIELKDLQTVKLVQDVKT